MQLIYSWFHCILTLLQRHSVTHENLRYLGPGCCCRNTFLLGRAPPERMGQGLASTQCKAARVSTLYIRHGPRGSSGFLEHDISSQDAP